jgi:16S rRNA (uracil1498-N3)-methyltransferase
MSLPFFFESDIPIDQNHFALSEETSKHCMQVLRMKSGERLQLTNGKGTVFIASIVNEDKKKTLVSLEESRIVLPAKRKISCCISLLKNANRFEWLLEKITEIGVFEIQPLLCKRTEHTRFRHDRLQSILIAAMLQSQQAWLPLLHEPVTFQTCINQSTYQKKMIAHCEKEKKQFIKDLPMTNDGQILIGPEGDFSPEEISFAIENGYTPITLGETRLRSETAGMVATALLVNA